MPSLQGKSSSQNCEEKWGDREIHCTPNWRQIKRVIPPCLEHNPRKRNLCRRRASVGNGAVIGTWLEASSRSIEVKTLGTQLSRAGLDMFVNFTFRSSSKLPSDYWGQGRSLAFMMSEEGLGKHCETCLSAVLLTRSTQESNYFPSTKSIGVQL